MYLYNLYGHEDSTVLMHEDRFTCGDFQAMCDEVPKVKLSNKYYYDEIEVEKHLIKNKGFKRAIYEVELFID